VEAAEVEVAVEAEVEAAVEEEVAAHQQRPPLLNNPFQ
jgi:hypothetical protein